MGAADPEPTPAAARLVADDRRFPTLTRRQVSRLASHGRRRETAGGELLVEIESHDIAHAFLMLALFCLMAAGAVIVGVTEIAAAARLRRQISGESSRAV